METVRIKGRSPIRSPRKAIVVTRRILPRPSSKSSTCEASAVSGLLTAGTPALGGAAAPARGMCLRRVVLGGRDRRPGTNDNDTNDNHTKTSGDETGHEE